MVARDPVKGEAVVQEIAGLGGQSEFFSVDLGDHDAVKALMEDVDGKYGALNVLVNCAGGSERNQGTNEASSVMQRWNQMSGGNFLSAYLVTTYALPIMRRTGGAVVNISSTATLHGNYGLYGAMKSGLEGLTRSMAMECAPLGIRVNAVCPGYIETPLTRPLFDSFQGLEEEVVARHPLGRLGQPHEIAEAVTWLSSNASSFVTGHTMTVDGGYVAQ